MSNENNNKTETTATAAEALASAAAGVGTKKVTKTITVEVIDIPEVEAESDGVREFARALNDDAIEIAETNDEKPTNPVRRNELVIANECTGGIKNFKEAFYAGLYKRPSGLEKVSYRPDGFVGRDGAAKGSTVLAAKQFVVTIKRNGKWETLPRYLATDEGGHFALGASQTLKAARVLASHLNFVWMKGGNPELLKKGGKKTAETK